MSRLQYYAIWAAIVVVLTLTGAGWFMVFRMIWEALT